MAYFDKYLYLKKSSLPGSGKGLFTRVDIPGKKIITEYKGRLRPWKEAKKEDGYNAYIFRLNNKWAIDAKNFKSTFGRYANDARGFSKITGLRNNSEYVTKGLKCYIQSIRRIKKGEEILVPYGKAFWDLLKKLNGKK